MLGRDIQSDYDDKLKEIKRQRSQELQFEASTLPVKYALHGSLFGALSGYYMSQGCSLRALRVSALGFFAGGAIGFLAKNQVMSSIPKKKY